MCVAAPSCRPNIFPPRRKTIAPPRHSPSCLAHNALLADGEVWAAKEKIVAPPSSDGGEGDKVAIKKISNCFVQATEAKRILRELRILRHLSHANIIRIRDVLDPVSESSFSDLWVVFDFVDLDLRKLIASPQTISVAHVQWISHQILAALQYLHTAHVLHRDLKPANVLLSGTCEVRPPTQDSLPPAGGARPLSPAPQ